MYQRFFGLTKEPFATTPDPAFLFLTAGHREALAGLSYAVLGGKGFVVLTGDAGTGKTTLLSKMLRSIPATRASFSVVLNPTLAPDEFLELALLDFGIREVPVSKAQRLVLLRQFLTDARQLGKSCVLVVDEAHKLAPPVLEEIRLLSNFELADAKLLQIVLAGQSELTNVLNRGDLRQLKQRISVRLSLHPLSQTDVQHYIQHRWTKAGGTQNHPFSEECIGLITHWSAGIPRLVNVICDNTLMLAFGEGVTVVTPNHIAEVASDLDLRPPANRNGRRPAERQPFPAPNTSAMVDTPQTAGNYPSIERYMPAASKPSRLSRWASKLGLGEARQRRYEQNL